MLDSRLKPIKKYLEHFPEESERLNLLQEQLRQDPDMFNRKNFSGHVTASVLLFKEASKEVLLIHHLGLNIWIQPGGHFENDPSLSASALRELKEETGIANAELVQWHPDDPNIPFDIDTHAIPYSEKKAELEHHHHDCLFLARVSGETKIEQQVEEIKGAAWRPVNSSNMSPRLQRVIKKARSFGLV